MAKGQVQEGVGPAREAGKTARGPAESQKDTVGRDEGRGSSSVIKRNKSGTRPFGGDLKATSKY